LLNESRALATPLPTVTPKLRDGLFAFSEPENVCVVDRLGAVVTTLVAVALAVLAPPLFDAVTATRSVYPTSALCAV
jgi:hypothetical protein